jgi:alpha-tubulin suppressor-like RCC1 family protein
LTDVLNTEKHSVIRAWGVVPEKLNFRRMDASELNGGVESIVCGQDHVLILSKDGRLYTAGNNKYGQCGVDINPAIQYEELRQIEFSGARCKAVAAGSYHTLLLAKKNNSTATRMLAFGNYLGCGFTEKLSSHLPKPVLLPALDPTDQVEDVFAACNNSACVTGSP